jgi:hypothetical protein
MTQTIIMGLAAINLIAVACFVTTNRLALVLLCQFVPVLLALGLSIFVFARFMGWPT